MPRFENPLTESIVTFLESIGIEVCATELDGDTVLPGLRVDRGRLLVDETRLTYPGDLLHEAGHLAVAPAARRAELDGDLAGSESMTTAWAYAATVHLGLDAAVLFHEGGYQGRSAGLIDTYGLGVYLGLPELVLAGLTDADVYPLMRRWLRD